MMIRIGFRVLVLALTVGFAPAQTQATPLVAPGATNTVAEGKDFATQVLRDPWDMDTLSDVSVWLNRSGQAFDTTDIKVANGVFSAKSTITEDTNFTVLFPGY